MGTVDLAYAGDYLSKLNLTFRHGRGQVLLLAIQDPRLGVLQDDPRFSRLRLRAVAA